jgi:predicted outer membrane repeat protein
LLLAGLVALVQPLYSQPAVPDLDATKAIYVDAAAAGTGDGVSWENAFPDLQSALIAAESGDQIWVAAGNYYPDDGQDQTAGDRAATFLLKNGVALFGGFAPGGGEAAQRDFSANVTTLSGDLNGDDGDDFTNRTDNSYHVLSATAVDETAVLDGFTITGGNADGAYPESAGGGLFCFDSGSPLITNCLFTGNQANGFGGAVFCLTNSSPTITNSVFQRNKANSSGGAISHNSFSSPLVINCAFRANTSSYGGVLHTFNGCDPEFINCLFQGNRGAEGGVVYNDLRSSPSLINCSLQGNQAWAAGGAIVNARESAMSIVNTIIWNNEEAGVTNAARSSVVNLDTSTASFAYSLVANSGGSGSWDTSLGTDGGNNIDTDPLFLLEVNPGTAPSAEGDLRLAVTSPALNVGDDSANPTDEDIDGNARKRGVIDLGAYETVGEPGGLVIHYVDTTASGNGDGTSWEDAFVYLQDALAVAGLGEKIHVATGTYYPDEGGESVAGDRNASFELVSGVVLLGGFPSGGGEGKKGGDPFANPTILSGDLDQNDSHDFAGTGENSYHVVRATGVGATAFLEGFIIQAGNADGAYPESAGGGLFCRDGASPTIQNCRFIRNQAVNSGAAVFNLSSSSPTIRQCVFELNKGGIGPAIANNSFSSPVVSDSLFKGNQGNSGGAVYNFNRCEPVFTNCVFQGNLADRGGAIYNDLNSASTLTNCSIQGNRARNDGGAILNDRESGVTIINSIIWGNSGMAGNDLPSASIHLSDNSTADIAYSLIANSGGSANWNAALGADGGNNIDMDPLFVIEVNPSNAPATEGNLRLLADSPAFDAGQNPDTITSLDLAGNQRIQNGVIDMGAYEGFSNVFSHLFGHLDADGDENGNGRTNFEDYSRGYDPSAEIEADDPVELIPSPDTSGITLLVPFSQRIGVDDVSLIWQRSSTTLPDSWTVLEGEVDYFIDSSTIEGSRQEYVLRIPVDSSGTSFYRGLFTESP